MSPSGKWLDGPVQEDLRREPGPAVVSVGTTDHTVFRVVPDSFDVVGVSSGNGKYCTLRSRSRLHEVDTKRSSRRALAISAYRAGRYLGPCQFGSRVVRTLQLPTCQLESSRVRVREWPCSLRTSALVGTRYRRHITGMIQSECLSVQYFPFPEMTPESLTV